jgi:cyclophilin family peptidyl-prolyl cis-trans isomerase
MIRVIKDFMVQGGDFKKVELLKSRKVTMQGVDKVLDVGRWNGIF